MFKRRCCLQLAQSFAVPQSHVILNRTEEQTKNSHKFSYNGYQN